MINDFVLRKIDINKIVGDVGFYGSNSQNSLFKKLSKRFINLSEFFVNF